MGWILMIALGYYIRKSHPRLGKGLMIVGAIPVVTIVLGVLYYLAIPVGP